MQFRTDGVPGTSTTEIRMHVWALHVLIGPTGVQNSRWAETNGDVDLFCLLTSII